MVSGAAVTVTVTTTMKEQGEFECATHTLIILKHTLDLSFSLFGGLGFLPGQGAVTCPGKSCEIGRIAIVQRVQLRGA